VCTDDDDLARRVEVDRNYGASTSAWARFERREGRLAGFERAAFNFKLTDIQAAVGIAQIARIPGLLAERRRIAAEYARRLEGVAGLALPPRPATEDADAHQAFVCTWAPAPLEELAADRRAFDRAVVSREALREAVAAGGVAFSDAAQCLPELPVFRAPGEEGAAVRARFPVAFAAARLSFALPIFPGMTPEQIARVADTVVAGARKARAAA
jgi:dTDP-4-amino-4,6-dideoxygalactose transaminase